MFCCCVEESGSTNIAEQVQVLGEGDGPVQLAVLLGQEAAFQSQPATKVEKTAAPVEPPMPAAAAAKLEETQVSKSEVKEVPPRDPSQLAQEPSPAASATFAVDIEKSSGMGIGLNLDILDGETALITLVKAGAVEKHNTSCDPLLQVKVGDRILKVNGVGDNGQQIIETIQSSFALKMVLRRPRPEFDVVLNKEAAAPLGLDLKTAPDSSLLISQIGEGPVKSWCDDASNTNKVTAYDRIVAVNGVRGKSQDLLNLLKGATKVTLTVQPFL